MATRPYDHESVIAVGSEAAWMLRLEYQPQQSWARVQLRMGNMRKWHDVTYTVEPSQPWAPRWHGRWQGNLSEFITLMEGTETPVPMTAAVAKEVASSYTVRLSGDAGDRAIHFRGGFAQPAPFGSSVSLLDEWRNRLCASTRIIG